MIDLKHIKRGYTRFLLNTQYAFSWRKPLLLYRIGKAYFQLLVLGKTPLRYVDVALGYSCNLRCQHCSAAKFSRTNEGRLTVQEYQKLAQECLDMGVVTVGITGGEPTLYPELDDVIQAFQPKKTMISLVTNATLLNEERILKYKKAGVDIICTSVDSAVAQEHDAFRGVAGAYDRTFNAIHLAQKHGLKVVIVTTVSHENIHSDNLQALIALTAQMKILLIFSLACPAGRWSQEDEKILLTKEDIIYMNQLFLKHPHLRRDFESNWFTPGCGAGNEKLYFTSYGDVIPCPFIHISFGNVKTTPLKTIHDRLLRIPQFKGYPPQCLSGEDMTFSKKYVIPANTQEKIPVDYKQIFNN